MEGAPFLDLDIDTLEAESSRIVTALEGIGPVNPLAVEEHAEETQADGVPAARNATT